MERYSPLTKRIWPNSAFGESQGISFMTRGVGVTDGVEVGRVGDGAGVVGTGVDVNITRGIVGAGDAVMAGE